MYNTLSCVVIVCIVLMLMIESGVHLDLLKSIKRARTVHFIRVIILIALTVSIPHIEQQIVFKHHDVQVRHSLTVNIPHVYCPHIDGLAEWACHTQGMEQSLTAMGAGTSPTK